MDQFFQLHLEDNDQYSWCITIYLSNESHYLSSHLCLDEFVIYYMIGLVNSWKITKLE